MTTAFFGSEGQLMVPGVAGFDGIGQLQTIVSSSESEPGAFTGSGGLAAIVTEPYPAPGEFPDFEHVMVDWFTPITYTCQKWPPTIEALQALIPFIFARKIDGSTDINGITERAHCKIVAVGHDRGQSQQIAKQVRNALRACADDGGATVNGVLIDFGKEITGQVEYEDWDALNRIVETDWNIEARRQWPWY